MEDVLQNGAKTYSAIKSINIQPSSYNNIIYPNQAKDFINIKVDNLIGAGDVVIYNVFGKIVKQQILSLDNNIIEINKLSKGMYLIYIIT